MLKFCIMEFLPVRILHFPVPLLLLRSCFLQGEGGPWWHLPEFGDSQWHRGGFGCLAELPGAVVQCWGPRTNSEECPGGKGSAGPVFVTGAVTQQLRTFWNCQCSCKGTNLGHDLLCWGLCVLQELLGFCSQNTLTKRVSVGIQTTSGKWSCCSG